MLTLTLAMALAQPPATQPDTRPTQPGAAQTQPLGTAPAAEQTFRVKSILGARVSVNNNTSVGTVEDLVFDQDGQIEYAIVADQGKFVTVPWAAVKWAAAAQPNLPMTATVAIPAEQYRVIPTFTATTYPSFFTPTYRTEVYRYYGLTPRERRILRR